MNWRNYQQGIYQWFLHSGESVKSYRSVDQCCKDMFQSSKSDQLIVDRPIYFVLYPLVRYGLIEFYGAKGFGLSPSTILFGSRYVLAINADFILGEIKEAPLFSELGFILLDKQDLCIDKAFLFSNIGQEFSYMQIIRRFSRFSSVIKRWDDYNIIDFNDLYFQFVDGNWKKSKIIEPGIYRKRNEEYSNRILYVARDQVKVIPTSRDNIDAFSIAYYLISGSKRFDESTVFDDRKGELQIKGNIFPILLERILFIKTLLNGEIEGAFSRRYSLSKEEYKHFRNVFN